MSPSIIPRCAPQTLRIDPEMASPLRKLNRVRRASDMDMWAISAEATATPAEVTAVTLFLELSTSDGGDELDMMEMLRECLREEEALDVEEHMGNEGRFAVPSSLLLSTRQRISSCNLPGSDKALTAIIELDHSAVASVNQLQRYRKGLLEPLRSKKGAVQALLSFDDGKDKGNGLAPAEHAPKGRTLPPPP